MSAISVIPTETGIVLFTESSVLDRGDGGTNILVSGAVEVEGFDENIGYLDAIHWLDTSTPRSFVVFKPDTTHITDIEENYDLW